MSRLIDADALYEKVQHDEELARNRVLDTESTLPYPNNLNPSYTRYAAQMDERIRLKEMIADAPTIEPEPCGDAVSREEAKWVVFCNRDHVEDQTNAIDALPSVTPKRKTWEISRSIDGSALIMWLNDWWYSSFGQEETPESKAIHKVLAKVAEYIGKRTLSEEPGYVESQSEEQILECCIGLMQEMADCFREYLEFIDHEPEYE